ncbi:hypothetical protein CASFOL_000497 [Castilleja foliolosa]|uniref:Helitron helicase-like domain-containing protein n=1 Tax=Castilleja foliolosa TaxID=1961234 RepID=A0ABD3EPJ1_9LAMI
MFRSKVVPFDISPLNDITNVICNSRQPGQRRGNQSNFNRNYSCINLTDNDLVENTVTYESDVPVGSIGISKKHNWTINTSQRIVPGSVVSTNARNNPSKRLKSFEDVFPFQNSPLSDITNVIEKDRSYGKRRGKQVQTQILTDIMIHNAFTNLDNNNLFDKTLTYGTDVMVNRSWLSNTAPSTNPPHLITSGSVKSINSGIHASSQLIHDVVPLRSSPLGHITNVIWLEVVQKQPLPRKNISGRSRRSVLELRQDKNVIDHPVLPSEYGDLGDASYECQFCHAEFWLDERCQKKGSYIHPRYNGCCQGGKVDLPRLAEPPSFLRDLLHGNSSRSKHFQDNIRSYNSMFCFTSMGGKVDHTINKGSGPRIFRLHGQKYHLIGSLLPEDGTTPKFAQVYIYDTENEVFNRKNSVRGSFGANNLCDDVIEGLKQMLDDNNKLVKKFRMAKNTIQEGDGANVRVRLLGKKRNNTEDRTRNLPTCSEVAVLVVGDFDNALGLRDIVKKFRVDIYKCLEDVVVSGDCDPKCRGKRIILPSTFSGGARCMIQNYQDAMAICRSVGYPDLFITFTCNPAWPEIVRFLEAQNMRPEDRPDIVTRVFKLKLNELIREMKKKIKFVYTIEFQKRGLPHAHILLFLAKENNYPTPDDIDRIISAEIPDKESDPTYYDAIKTHMMHVA